MQVNVMRNTTHRAHSVGRQLAGATSASKLAAYDTDCCTSASAVRSVPALLSLLHPFPQGLRQQFARAFAQCRIGDRQAVSPREYLQPVERPCIQTQDT